MKFNVGPWVFRVRVAEERMFDCGGGELLGRVDFSKREVQLSPECRAEQRLDTVLHELAHIWRRLFAVPNEEEQACDFFAAMTRQAMVDFAKEGGVITLMRMKPEPAPDEEPVPATDPWPHGARLVAADYIDSSESTAKPHGARAQCLTCELEVTGGMVAMLRNWWSDEHAGLLRDCAMYCPHCGHVQIVTVGCDDAGRPNGTVIPSSARRLRGAGTEAFLAEHPECAGLAMA